MENTLEKTELNAEYENLTNMDLGNSFDYTNDYYFNSFDYILDVEDTIQTTSSKGCQVVSSKDSISIVHENGSDKHISNPPYECASEKYEAKKAAKKATKPSQMSSVEKAKLQAKKNELKAKLAQKATDSVYTEPYTHSKADVARQASTYTSKTTYNTNTTTQNSHDEVFGNNNTTQKNNSGTFVKLFILLFIFFPIISSILSSCGAFISALFR